MSMNIDRSLDDIITSKKKTRRTPGRGGPPRGGIAARRTTGRKVVTPGIGPVRNQYAAPPNAAPNAAAQRKQQQPPVQKIPGVPDGLQGSKIVVSNLPDDVTEPQIRELFSTTIGPLKTVQLTFDSNGRSKGIATVEFKNLSDGAKAFHQYNKRLIDQKRPMKVEIIVDPSKAPPAPLTSRIAPLPAQPKPQQQPRVAAAPKANGAAPVARGAGGRGGRRGGRGRGGRGGRESRPQVSKEDLDQEMTDWVASAETTQS